MIVELHTLRTNHLDTPLGVDAARLIFSWRILGAAQRRCKVDLYACGPTGGSALVWCSERRDQVATMLAYDGESLACRQRYRWSVQVWTADGAVVSADAEFETPIADEDWVGAWIAMPGFATPMFRSAFEAASAEDVAVARWYVACAGLMAASINGQPVTDEVLYPDFTDYSVAVTTMTFDVGDSLRDGENVLGLVLGGGWYEHQGYGRRTFRSQFEITRMDGSREVFASVPADWLVRPGAWSAEDVVHGEWFDARLDVPGWDEPGFAPDLSWHQLGRSFGKPANAAEPPGGVCIGRRGPGQRVIAVQSAIERRVTGAQSILLDFGENRAGRIRVRGSAPAGTRLAMRMGEHLDANDRLSQLTNKGARGVNAYTFSGAGAESWAPQFSYQGFRYVELSGNVADWDALSIEREVLASHCPRTVAFDSDHEGLNALFEMSLRTIESNLFGLLTDCPQRDERQGWLADAWAVTPTVLTCLDSLALYRKWMEDMVAIQDPRTGFRWSPTAPPSPRYVQRLPRDASRHRLSEWIDEHPQSDSVYTAGCTIIPWQYYMATGEPGHLERFYPGIAAHLDAMANRPDFPILGTSWHGDHAAMGWTMDPAAERTPTELVAASVFLQELEIGGAMARHLGRDDDAARFDALARRSRRELADRWYDAARGGFGSQGADAMALELGFCPDGAERRVLEALIADLHARTHLTSGLVSSPYVLAALSRRGHGQEAFDAVTAAGEPGFMWWYEQGWTTLGEHAVSNWPDTSRNQPGWALVCEWVLTWVAGIRVLEPGYTQVEVQPRLPVGVNRLAVTLSTCMGRINVEAQRSGDRVRVAVDADPCIRVISAEARDSPRE